MSRRGTVRADQVFNDGSGRSLGVGGLQKRDTKKKKKTLGYKLISNAQKIIGTKESVKQHEVIEYFVPFK